MLPRLEQFVLQQDDEKNNHFHLNVVVNLSGSVFFSKVVIVINILK